MKKLRIFGFAALVAVGAVSMNSCGKTKGCMTAADDNYDALATEDDGSCDEAGTSGKFVGNWTGTPGAYPFNVSIGTADDYMINVSTNFGLVDGSGNQLTPANLNNWTVVKNQATLSSATLYNGTVSGTVSYVSASSMSVTYTIAGGTAADGTYTESLSL